MTTKDEIINIVCEVCGVAPEDLTTEDRSADVVMARHLIIHHLYWRLNMQPPEIAPIVGMKRPSVYKPLFRNPMSVRVKTEMLLRERYGIIASKIFQ